MNKRSIVAFLLLLTCSVTEWGQSAVALQAPPPSPKQDRIHLSFKAYYFSHTPNIKRTIAEDKRFGEIAGFARHAAVGFAFEIPCGQIFYIQPEALFSLNTNWQDASFERGVFNELCYGFKHRDGFAMDIPVFFGARWPPARAFATRAYLGPSFHFGWNDKEFLKDFRHYDFVLGVGVDLLNILSVDAGYRVGMDVLSYTGDSWYFLAAGIKL